MKRTVRQWILELLQFPLDAECYAFSESRTGLCIYDERLKQSIGEIVEDEESSFDITGKWQQMVEVCSKELAACKMLDSYIKLGGSSNATDAGRWAEEVSNGHVAKQDIENLWGNYFVNNNALLSRIIQLEKCIESYKEKLSNEAEYVRLLERQVEMQDVTSITGGDYKCSE
jgi:hypothetical protein